MEANTCAQCGEVTRNKKYCSTICSALAASLGRQVRFKKPCEVCETETINKRYCSRRCAGLAQRRAPEEIVARRREGRAQSRKRRASRNIVPAAKMTDDEYNQMLKAQNGLCAVCRSKPAAVRDHCHRTGVIRGLLCVSCNSAIGVLGDSIEGLMRAVDYLRKSELGGLAERPIAPASNSGVPLCTAGSNPASSAG